MSKVFSRLKDKVEKGRLGLNSGIPTRLSRMDYFTTGIQQGDYWLIGAETNVGKTKFVRDQFIYEPYNYWLKNKDKFNIHFIDFSLEMTAEDNLADLISKDIYVDYGKVISRSVLLSQGRNKEGVQRRLEDEYYDMLCSYEERYADFEKHLTIIDTDVTPSFFHDVLMKYAEAHGTFEKESKFIGRRGKYTPKDDNLYTIILFDTINLADAEPKQTVKETIDRISRICVWFRKVCNFTPVIIQQFGAELSSTDRSRHGIKTPLLRDFEDSKRTTKDATIVLGLFDPTRHAMEEILEYNVLEMKNWIRTLHLLKNRNGEMNKSVALQFKGAIGMFEELPSAQMFKDNPGLYKLVTKY